MAFRFELDNMFSRYGLGEVYLDNDKKDKDLWRTDDHDYVTIKVPASLQKRFDIFWRSACKTLGVRLTVYHVQNGLPSFKGWVMVVDFYFISVESAGLLYHQFYDLLPAGINNPDEWVYDQAHP